VVLEAFAAEYRLQEFLSLHFDSPSHLAEKPPLKAPLLWYAPALPCESAAKRLIVHSALRHWQHPERTLIGRQVPSKCPLRLGQHAAGDALS
jgi:hypothetical protein